MNRPAPASTMRTICCVVAAAFATAAGAAEHVVGQKNKSFTVSNVEAKVGDEVLFRNDDAVFHSIFSLTAGQSFDLGAYAPGLSKKVMLDQPGRIDVECAIHPRMKMVIDVTR
jgi:plastocyanin